MSRAALTLACAAVGLIGRRFLPKPTAHSNGRRPRTGALRFLEVMEEMDPSPKMKKYIEQRRAEIEAEAT